MLEKNNIKKGIRTLFTVDRKLTNKLVFLSNGIIFTWKGIYSIQWQKHCQMFIKYKVICQVLKIQRLKWKSLPLLRFLQSKQMEEYQLESD